MLGGIMRNNDIKTLFLLSFLFVVFGSYAQNGKSFIDKGNVFISGSISVTDNFGELYSLSPYDTGKIVTIQANPEILYFINKKIGLGVEFLLAHQYLEEFEMSGTDIGVGPKLKYFSTLGSSYPFLGVNVDYLNRTVADIVKDGVGLTFSAGLLTPITGNIAFLIEGGYRWEKIYYDIEPLTGGTIFLNIGIGGIISPKLK
jgi:hypothetical protein